VISAGAIICFFGSKFDPKNILLHAVVPKPVF
jgi:hypothetical protein